MATDRTAGVRPGLDDQVPGRVRPGGRRAGWWRGWFTPARGLRPRPLDVLVALVIAFVQVAGTIDYSRGEPSPWAFDAFACIPLLAGPVALLFRRRWPEATLAATFAAAAGYAASGWPRGPAGFPAFGFAVANAIMMGRSSFACTSPTSWPSWGSQPPGGRSHGPAPRPGPAGAGGLSNLPDQRAVTPAFGVAPGRVGEVRVASVGDLGSAPEVVAEALALPSDPKGQGLTGGQYAQHARWVEPGAGSAAHG